MLDNIGNLTLLEGKNSKNGHKGNSSLGTKSFKIKKESYKNSCSKLTRKTATMKSFKNIEVWTEEHIKKRSKIILNKLHEWTDY